MSTTAAPPSNEPTLLPSSRYEYEYKLSTKTQITIGLVIFILLLIAVYVCKRYIANNWVGVELDNITT